MLDSGYWMLDARFWILDSRHLVLAASIVFAEIYVPGVSRRLNCVGLTSIQHPESRILSTRAFPNSPAFTFWHLTHYSL
ncbi:MAG: hypothetical protein QF886_12175, partial [Planctomycetota bacterium]|nr:hypothetical protein [Planctomycetota bacterium]